MTILGVAVRATRHHWRTHLPALAFVALATAIVTGALEVQTSIRSRLHSALVNPLGRITDAVCTTGTFRANLASSGEMAALALNATASNQTASSPVQATVWGFGSNTEAFWSGLLPVSAGKAMVSGLLAKELNLEVGSPLFIRVPRPDSAPLASVFGRRLATDSTVELRLVVATILKPGGVGDLSLTPTLGEKSLAIVDREWLCDQLKTPSRANVILTREPVSLEAIARRFTLTDHGLNLANSPNMVTITSDRVLMTEGQVLACDAAAQQCGCKAMPSLVALAERIRHGNRSISYAMAAAISQSTDSWIAASKPAVQERMNLDEVNGTFHGQRAAQVRSKSRVAVSKGLRLNAWAADDLKASVGDQVEVDLLVPNSDGSISRRTVTGLVSSILPMSGDGANPSLVPNLAGMTDSVSISNWSTPFPIDLSRITSRDEAYWKRFRAAPKVFVDEDVARQAWGTRLAATSVTVRGGRLASYPEALSRLLNPEYSGISVLQVGPNAERASMGSADLAGLLLGLSSFLILAALGLAGSILLLNFQSRSLELALMTNLGLPRRVILSLLVTEAMFVALSGAVIGSFMAAIIAKISLAMFSHWMPTSASFGDVGIVVSAHDLFSGLAVGVLCALAAAFLYARPLFTSDQRRRRPSLKPPRSPLTTGRGLLIRSIRQRPMRFLSPALIVAAGTAVLGVAAGSLNSATSSANSEIGLEVETNFPLGIDWTTPNGRRRLRFEASDEPVFQGITAYSLLRSRGSDTSCLNPAKPVTPRLTAIRDDFLRQPPFPAETADGADAWRLLGLHTIPRQSNFSGSSDIEAVADAYTLDWILGSGLGKRYPVVLSNGNSATLKFVGVTHGTFLATDILVSEAAFRSLYPDIDAPSLFLVKVPSSKAPSVGAALRRNLSDYGVTVRDTPSIIRALHGVSNAYISIFLVFGSLGLILGVCGSSLAAARNALERRTEFALMLALGISRSRVAYWIVAETHLAVLMGSFSGLAIAIVIDLIERTSVSWQAFAVELFITVLASSLACVAVSKAFLRHSVIQALRSE